MKLLTEIILLIILAIVMHYTLPMVENPCYPLIHIVEAGIIISGILCIIVNYDND